MPYSTRLTLAVCLLLTSFASSGATVLSSVSPEFANGLHSKYLTYVARQMDKELVIIPMPYARRVRALQNGDIDIMVGAPEGLADQPGIQLIYPHYIATHSSYFILKSQQNRLRHKEDLAKLLIGATTPGRYFTGGDQQSPLDVVEVSGIRQKIRLLMRNRLDAFIHVKESAQVTLKDMGLEQHIVQAPYQDTHTLNYYFAISTASSLMQEKARLESLIKKAIVGKEFARIRTKHYGHPKP